MTTPRPFSIEEDDLIRQHVGRDTYTVIAYMMVGRTRNMVIGRARRMGVAGTAAAPVMSKGRPGMQRKPRDKTAPLAVKRATHLGPHKRIALVKAPGDGFHPVEFSEPILDLPNLWCEPVDLLDLQPHQCRWPMDGGKFCGLAKTVPEFGRTEYCVAHYRQSVAPRGVYRKPLLRRN